MEKYADNAIGNVMGSNSVNVFLGLGLPWLMAAIYWQAQVLHIIMIIVSNITVTFISESGQ